MKIKSAAILYSGKIYEGQAHCDIGLQMIRDKVCRRPFPGADSQGFITECGRFVSREEALVIAIENGQVVKGRTCNPNRLFSEDLRHIKP
jgi:hypothetical protein